MKRIPENHKGNKPTRQTQTNQRSSEVIETEKLKSTTWNSLSKILRISKKHKKNLAFKNIVWTNYKQNLEIYRFKLLFLNLKKPTRILRVLKCLKHLERNLMNLKLLNKIINLNHSKPKSWNLMFQILITSLRYTKRIEIEKMI